MDRRCQAVLDNGRNWTKYLYECAVEYIIFYKIVNFLVEKIKSLKVIDSTLDRLWYMGFDLDSKDLKRLEPFM